MLPSTAGGDGGKVLFRQPKPEHLDIRETDENPDD